MPSFSRNLEESLHRAVAFANQRKHEYATLEHLLLSLIDDPFVSQGTVMMKARGEISFNGLGSTPFSPPNVIIPQPQGFLWTLKTVEISK